MGLFGSKKEGGLMDVIRCDEQDYLIWKWRPNGETSRKENAIRYGSNLRVQDGEVAVFVYKQNDNAMREFIEGPFDQTIKTANFPILTSIVGSAFGGSSPFQAEIYFINWAQNIQIPFFVRNILVSDFRYEDYQIPMTLKGQLQFKIPDYKAFIKKNRMRELTLEDFKEKVRAVVTNMVMEIMPTISNDFKISALQLSTKIRNINQYICENLKMPLEEEFGVELRRTDIENLTMQEDCEGYKMLKSLSKAKLETEKDILIQNAFDTQRINAINQEESQRIMREETQRAQRLQTESNFIGAHGLDQQTSILRTAASSLGKMGNMEGNQNGGMNPASMMTSMMMGGAVGGQMANMMNTMGQGMGQNMYQHMNTPPPPPISQYMIIVNGQQSGPFNIDQLAQLKNNGSITPNTYVWKQGMPAWDLAGNIQELAGLFLMNSNTPPPPPPGAL